MKPTLEAVRALFPAADVREIRGKVYLESMTVDKLLGSVPLSFTRRRYAGNVHRPGVTYTWAEAFVNGQWLDLGDPWPCLMPRTIDLEAAIAQRTTTTAPKGPMP